MNLMRNKKTAVALTMLGLAKLRLQRSRTAQPNPSLRNTIQNQMGTRG